MPITVIITIAIANGSGKIDTKNALKPSKIDIIYITKTALFFLNFKDAKIWEEWSFPPKKMDLFSINLKKVTSVVSKIGYPKTRIGKDKDRLILSVSQLPNIAIDANVNPRNMLPESPIKILAFGKLCFRKPKHAPAKASERIAT